MKLIQELQSPDVTALKPKVIAAEIEEIARGRRHFQQLLRENRDLVNKPGDYVDFTYRYGAALFQKVTTKLTEVSWSNIGFSSVRITVEKWGGKLQFAREDLEAASRDVLAESLFEAGLDYAEQTDYEAKLSVLGAVQSVVTVVCDGYNASLPSGTQLVEITSVAGSATGYSAADYYDGIIEVSGAAASTSAPVIVTYYHTTLPATQFKKAYSEGNFAFRDLQAMRDAVVAQNYHPTVAVMNPSSITTLLRDTEAKFLDASAYGAREPILNGEIGKAGGLKLIDTTRQMPHIALAIDPDHAGRWVVKKPLESTRRDMSWVYGLEYNLWAFFKPGLIKNTAIAVVVNVGGTFKSLA